MKHRSLFTAALSLGITSAIFAGCGDSHTHDDDAGVGGAGGEDSGSGGTQAGITGGGLIFTIDAVEVSDEGVATVDFSITDDQERPLDLDGRLTEGAVSPNFVLSRLGVTEAGESKQYIAYTTRVKESEAGNETQSSADSGGTYEKLALGRYRYTLGTKIDITKEREGLTHTLGVYATRTVSDVRYVASDMKHWVPDGSDVEIVQDVVTDAACNDCHTRLEFHGGSRRGVGMCNLCHTEENSINPESGNTFDFQVMIHKIHMGKDLPSVEAGEPYYFIGFGGKRIDYSEVSYPWDMRDCAKCHDGTQGDRWVTRPTEKPCSSCHDRTYFGEGDPPEGWTKHTAGPRDDSECGVCHGEDSLEPISKSHRTSLSDVDRPVVEMELLEVTNSGPNSQPNVEFSLTVDGSKFDLIDDDFGSLTLRFWGPNSDVTTAWSENPLSAGECDDAFTRPCLEDNGATYTYYASTPVPEDATGSFTAGAEGAYSSDNVTFPNPLLAFAVTGDLEERRPIVTMDTCNSCHGDFGFHRNSARKEPQLCLACHNPGATQRGGDLAPGEEDTLLSINLKDLVHRVHAGAGYPAPLSDCSQCHVESSHEVPLPQEALASSYVNRSLGMGGAGGSDPELMPFEIQPESAACVTCHSAPATLAHAETNTGTSGEACGTCHGSGKGHAVSDVHAPSP